MEIPTWSELMPTPTSAHLQSLFLVGSQVYILHQQNQVKYKIRWHFVLFVSFRLVSLRTIDKDDEEMKITSRYIANGSQVVQWLTDIEEKNVEICCQVAYNIQSHIQTITVLFQYNLCFFGWNFNDFGDNFDKICDFLVETKFSMNFLNLLKKDQNLRVRKNAKMKQIDIFLCKFWIFC